MATGCWRGELNEVELQMLEYSESLGLVPNDIPTAAELTRHFELDDELPSVSVATVHRMLKKLGLKYKKRSRNARLIEATHIVQWRCKYLRRMSELRRHKKNIFYINETWVNAGHTVGQVWVDTGVASGREAKRSGSPQDCRTPSPREKG
ncbi:hypothetical protein HPB47_004091 [Ixodes persulcatus]|uniref:Uncharacterized protein n=1 Tax=Ixodes persulcatus TaxID=34615 RepID=A0AC60PH82_IXOPE|nr:hypothetical protein HPB47_004091 [Ixodes persulcatus]